MLVDDAVCVVRVTIKGKTLTRRISRDDIEEAVASIICATLDGELAECGDFAFGFAAALDMFVGGTLDFVNPIGMVIAALRDAEDTTTNRRMVTDFLPVACSSIGARE